MAIDYENVKINEKSILKRLASRGHANAADAINVDESTITNLKDPNKHKINIRSISTLLDYLGLKIVDKRKVCYVPEEIQPYIDMAKKYINSQDAVSLQWAGDDE